MWVLGSGGLLRSTDAGRHFVRVAAPPLPEQGTAPTLVFANPRDGFAYVADGADPLYATRDGGESWHRDGLAGKVLAFATGGGDVYVAMGQAIERSPVGRIAWRTLAPVVSQPVSLAALRSHVWVLGPPRRSRDTDTLSLSPDRGRTFAQRKGPCFSELGGGLAPTGGGKVVWAVCSTGNFSVSLRSTDGGRTFATLRTPGQTNGARIYPVSAREAVLDPAVDGLLYRTVDAGRRWTSVSGTPRLGGIYWLDFSTPRTGTALIDVGSATRLWRTTDGGATWHVLPLR